MENNQESKRMHYANAAELILFTNHNIIDANQLRDDLTKSLNTAAKQEAVLKQRARELIDLPKNLESLKESGVFVADETLADARIFAKEAENALEGDLMHIEEMLRVKQTERGRGNILDRLAYDSQQYPS